MESLIVLTLTILLNAIVLFLISFLGIKFAKIRNETVIYMKQYFISMLSTVIISCLFPPVIIAVLFIALFFLYRMVIFRKDAAKLHSIYTMYESGINPPQIKCFSDIFDLYKQQTTTEIISREYQYSFSSYLNNTIYIFIFYCANGMYQPENIILYGLEFFIVITALYIGVAKLTYNLAVSSPTSPFFLSPTLSYIPVVLAGVLIYTLAIIMFISTI